MSPHLGYLTMLVLGTALAVLQPHLALAQAESASVEKPREFNIPAQQLNVALRTFAELTGVQLVYSSSLVTGLDSVGVKGSFSVDQALQRLLTGTGLTFRIGNGNTVMIERSKSSDTRVLGPVRVEGAGSRIAGASDVNGINGSRDVTATEGTGSYTSNALAIGSKTAQSMKDTPQSVSVITAQRMEEQNITDFTQAMNQATGITLLQSSSHGSTFYSRGFAITSIQVDGGAPLGVDPIFSPLFDMAEYDHVELLRGAAGLLNGYGDPSGSVNLVRKKPLDHSRVSMETLMGSWKRYRASLDASSPLGFDGKLRGRAVLTYQGNEFFYDIATSNRTSVYGILEYDLTPSTLLSGGTSILRQDAVPWTSGLPRYEDGGDLNLPRNTALTFPWNRLDIDNTQLFARVEQALGNDWSMKVNVIRNQQKTQRKLGSVSGAVNPRTNAGPLMSANGSDLESMQWTGEVTLSGAFELLGQRQVLSMGYNRAATDGSNRKNYNDVISSAYVPYPGAPAGSPRIDVFHFDPADPLYSEPRGGLLSGLVPVSGSIQSGAFVHMNLTAFDRLHLITGVRYSSYRFRQISNSICTTITGPCAGKHIGDPREPVPDVTDREDKDFSWPPTYSLVYDVTPGISVYGGYTDIYLSQVTLVDANLESLMPITGYNLETGVKWEAREGRLNANLSAYRIEKKNMSIRDASRNFPGIGLVDNFGTSYGTTGELPDGSRCCYLARKDQTYISQGADLEITGEVLPRWQLSLGYTFNENKQVGAGFQDDDGKPIVSRSPEHLLKIWTSYSFRGHRWLDGLSIGGGANGQTSAYESGRACVAFNPPNPTTGAITCKTNVDYDYTQKAYAVVSARADYQLGKSWSIGLNVDNLTDKRYYQTMGSNLQGNWYGEPRAFALSLRGQF